MRDADKRNVLVIGDLHEPFCLDDYLSFCIDKYYEYMCTEVVFIGDIIDNHFSSYHETSADGLGGLTELNLAIERIQRWRNAFPVATVVIGNHDRIIMRKAQTSSIPSKWIKSYKDVLEVPEWNFVERYEKDDVQYIHGEGGTARTKCRADMMNKYRDIYILKPTVSIMLVRSLEYSDYKLDVVLIINLMLWLMQSMEKDQL